MPSPFPGMDPYLEGSLWKSVHSRLIVAIADALNEQLDERYRVEIEQRTYFTGAESSLSVGIPDVAVLSNAETALAREAAIQASAVATVDGPQAITVELPLVEEVQERYLDVQDVETGTVVTTIELLSPKNKQAGEGRIQYERKRNRVLASLTHLVEIDLIRAGNAQTIRNPVQSDYRILISRSQDRPQAQLYAFNLDQPIPSIPIPLLAGDPPVPLDLQQLLNAVYVRGKYHLVIDYGQTPPPPAIPASMQGWVQELLFRR